MALAGDGDHDTDESFDAFYRGEYGRVCASLKLMGASGAVAEELTQDAFVKAFRYWRRVSAMDRPGAWLQTVAVNLLRKRQIRSAKERDLEASDRTERAGIESAMDLKQAIALLPFDQRAAVVLRHVLGHTTAETAAMLGRSETALRALLYRAMQDLRRDPLLLGEQQEDVW
jgi:RNA polymerase sigma factor (sigma-70 family)